MNDILKTYKEQFRENRHTLRRCGATPHLCWRLP